MMIQMVKMKFIRAFQQAAVDAPSTYNLYKDFPAIMHPKGSILPFVFMCQLYLFATMCCSYVQCTNRTRNEKNRLNILLFAANTNTYRCVNFCSDICSGIFKYLLGRKHNSSAGYAYEPHTRTTL